MKIAFGYKMGVGKDSAVDYMINKYGGKKISFAQPIYDILHYAQKVCGFSIEKDRKFLQYIGTDWGQEKDKNVWIRIALEKSEQDNDNVYISDVRFLNEFKALKENGWTLVKIVRPHNEEREGTGSIQHVSETELDSLPNSEWDYIIHNDSTLESFYKSLDTLVNEKLC